jgi:antitoxin component of RelBE/YafQ-DinJ toxin-antitoxin module
MDAKITLSFDASVIDEAKKFAESHNISLSRLTEFLLRKTVSTKHYSLDNLPVSDWVNMVSEGKAEYNTKPKSSKSLKKEYLKSRQ